jgi:hypothetical protein
LRKKKKTEEENDKKKLKENNSRTANTAAMVTAAVTATAGAVPPATKTKLVGVDLAPPPTVTRRHLFLAISAGAASTLPAAAVLAAAPKFTDIPASGGVKALDLREGRGEVPVDGDQVLPGADFYPLIVPFLLAN